MDDARATHLLHKQPNRGSMRVVVLEPSAEFREELCHGLEQMSEFHVVGDSCTWEECLRLLEIFVPELLIARTTCVPGGSPPSVCEGEFPVVLGLRLKSAASLACAFEIIDLPMDNGRLRAAMERVRAEIYRRKLEGLCALFGRYMDYSRGVHRFLSAVPIQNGGNPEIPTENVVFVAADGNYLRLHTGTDIHEIRDTMSGLTSKLDPAQFTRIHRSFIVNRAHVASVLRKEGTAMTVLLSDGTEIPVGPNYRAEVDSLNSFSRLSA
jgi:two-component system, LytTR family, response regulator